MKPIGGYFELELNQQYSPAWLTHGVEVNSSRHALEYILKANPNKLRLIHVPYYTCEVVLEPIKRLGIDYHFYHINSDLETDSFPLINEDEKLIINNYFGIKDGYINKVLKQYGDKVIVDNAQAFYHTVNSPNKAFYSPRKLFGVPDGGYAITPDILDMDLPLDYSTERTSHLLRRLDAGAEDGYTEFKKNDSSISVEPLKSMSHLTRSLLNSIDYARVKRIRRKNFETLHTELAKFNKLHIPDQDSFECPMIYPFLTDDDELRTKLIKSKIFVATYWPNIFDWCEKSAVEYQLAERLIPLPIDQRYNEEDMNRILTIISQ